MYCTAAPGEGEDVPIPPTAPLESYTESGTCGGASSGESAWAGLMKQVVSDSPEILSAGVGQLAGYAGHMSGTTAGGGAQGSVSGPMSSALQQPPPAAGTYSSGDDGTKASVMQG